jgi:FtsH-binding integral membrane protein
MNKEKLKILGIIFLVLALVIGTFVGNVYFNIPMEYFPYIFSITAMVWVGISKVFSKGDQKPPPEPSKEYVLRSKVAGCAGLSGLAVILGIALGFNVISYFEKAGKSPSIYWLFVVLIGVPATGIFFFIKKRKSIIRNMSNQEDAPDLKPVR